jgi:hypothetical protein
MDVITNWVEYIVLGECVGCDGCDQWKDASSFPSYCCLTLALVLFSVVVGSVAFCCCLGPLHFVSGFQKTKEAERKPRTDLLTYINYVIG